MRLLKGGEFFKFMLLICTCIGGRDLIFRLVFCSGVLILIVMVFWAIEKGIRFFLPQRAQRAQREERRKDYLYENVFDEMSQGMF